MLEGLNSVLETWKERAGKLEDYNRSYPIWKTEMYFKIFKTEPKWPTGNVKYCNTYTVWHPEKRDVVPKKKYVKK